MMRTLVTSMLIILCACGGDDDPNGGGPSGAGGSGTGSGPSGPSGSGGGATTGAGGQGTGGIPAETTTLVDADWTLAPGTEMYQCTRVTIESDMYIRAFYPVIPQGTHHTVVTLGSGGEPDGTQECGDPFEGAGRMIYGTGVGSVPQIFPDGVAIKIAAGQQVHLNLHLFNVGGAELSGHSGIEVVTVEPGEVVHEAEAHLFGKSSGLEVAPSTTSTQTATCTVASDVETFIVQPHMHQLGTHLRGAVTPAGGATQVLFDAPYDFDAQVHVDHEPPVSLRVGDTLDIECTYDNPTPNLVTFGESSNDEMCFLGLFVYPANQPVCY